MLIFVKKKVANTSTDKMIKNNIKNIYFINTTHFYTKDIL